MLVSLEDSSYAILTRTRENLKSQDAATLVHSSEKGKDILTRHGGMSKVVPGVAPSSSDSFTNPFDIIEFCKTSCVQISLAEYLKLNPRELDTLVEFVKVDDAHALASETQTPMSTDSPAHANFSLTQVNPESSSRSIPLQDDLLELNLENKPEPFHVSLYINGHKLSNCIIDSGASNNVMPSVVAKFLGLTLTKTFGKCYSMDSKQVPLLGQIKDAQVALVTHPTKRIRLTILVADIPASYGMLLSCTFCKDMGKEIKMDWSQAAITVGKQRVLLHPETEAKYTVFPSDDPKAQILYQDCGFGNYMISTDPQDESMLLDAGKSNELWSMEFDGSCSSSRSGVGVVLIPSRGKVIPYSFKLEFQNTNNTAEYEALLLGLAEAKRLQIKMLRGGVMQNLLLSK